MGDVIVGMGHSGGSGLHNNRYVVDQIRNRKVGGPEKKTFPITFFREGPRPVVPPVPKHARVEYTERGTVGKSSKPFQYDSAFLFGSQLVSKLRAKVEHRKGFEARKKARAAAVHARRVARKAARAAQTAALTAWAATEGTAAGSNTVCGADPWLRTHCGGVHGC